MRLAEDDRNRSDAILRVPVRTRSGKLVELGNLVDVSRDKRAGANRSREPHAAR